MDTLKEKPEASVRKIHPVIAALERSGEPTASFTGYLGADVESSIRIYPELDTSAYIEFPKSALLHLQSAEGDTSGMIRAFVPASLRVIAVRRQSTLAASAMRELSDLRVVNRRPSLWTHPFWQCAKQCEGAFAARVATVHDLEIRALREQRPEAKVVLESAVAAMKHEAEGVLHACLAECESKNGAPAFMEGPGAEGGDGPLAEPYSRSRYHQRLVRKYRLYGGS